MLKENQANPPKYKLVTLPNKKSTKRETYGKKETNNGPSKMASSKQLPNLMRLKKKLYCPYFALNVVD